MQSLRGSHFLWKGAYMRFRGKLAFREMLSRTLLFFNFFKRELLHLHGLSLHWLLSLHGSSLSMGTFPFCEHIFHWHIFSFVTSLFMGTSSFQGHVRGKTLAEDRLLLREAYLHAYCCTYIFFPWRSPFEHFSQAFALTARRHSDRSAKFLLES